MRPHLLECHGQPAPKVAALMVALPPLADRVRNLRFTLRTSFFLTFMEHLT